MSTLKRISIPRVDKGAGIHHYDKIRTSVSRRFCKHRTLPKDRNIGDKRTVRCFLGYTRSHTGVVTKRHFKEICSTLHTKIGCFGNTSCFVIEIYEKDSV